MKPVLGNFSFKPQNGLTRREFFLVAIMIIAIEGYLLFTYFVQPAYNDYVSVKTVLQNKQALLDSLKADYSKKPEMDKVIQKLDGQLTDIKKQIPSYLSQEEVILLLDGLSGKDGLAVQSISFQNASSLPLKAKPSGKKPEETGDKGTKPVPTMVDQNIGVTFTGGYDQIYGFLKDIEGSLRKVAVKGMILQRNSGTELTGQMTLDFISYWDGNKGQEPFTMAAAPIPGKASPFEQYPGYSANAEQGSPEVKTSVQADFYLLVNSYLNNSAKVVLMNFYKSGSEASMDINGPVRASLVIEGGKGSYTYSYTVGSSSQREKTATAVKNGKIGVDVIVQPRKSDEDKVSAVLDVTNKTDIPVEIKVSGDDSKAPRFVLGKTQGSVSLK
jgi:Tfp pilus assembly protein PilO